MTNNQRNIYTLLVFISATGALYLLNRPDGPSTDVTRTSSPQRNKVTTQINRNLSSIGTRMTKEEKRKVLGVPDEDQEAVLRDLKISNTISSDWEEHLQEVIKRQGGDSLKKVDISKVESYVWNRDGHALNVESVIVSIENEKGEVSKFRAMIDSQNGRILESWDRPVTDPMDPKDDFRLKIDPRYSN